MSKLRHRAISLAAANDFVALHHRHHKPVRGHKFSLAAYLEDNLVGVAIVGRPVSRHRDTGLMLEITRLCTNGTPNACSFLLSRCERAAYALGYDDNISTYILETENGASLRAANWEEDGKTKGGSWSRACRERTDNHPIERKTRWKPSSRRSNCQSPAPLLERGTTLDGASP